MRILLVEDEPSGALFIAKGLREASHAVDIAHDGVCGAGQRSAATKMHAAG